MNILRVTLLIIGTILLGGCQSFHAPILGMEVPGEGERITYKLGLDYYNKMNLIQAIEKLEPLAKQGHIDAQYLMGRIYADGYGENVRFRVTKDYKRIYKNPTIAAKWFLLAAEQGSNPAMYSLGELFRDGEGVIKYLPVSHMWFNIAASRGYEKASRARDRYDVSGAMTPSLISYAENLASKCIEEKELKNCAPLEEYTVIPDVKYTIKRDSDYFAIKPSKAYINMDIASLKGLASEGDVDAQFRLGKMYYEGKNVLKNTSEAKKWYEMSATAGHALAQHVMGDMYRKGLGVEKNMREALKYYELAASQGIGDSMLAIGRLMYHGELEISQNNEKYSRKVLSFIWFNMAVSQVAYFASSWSGREVERYLDGRDFKKNIFKKLSLEQRDIAQELTRQCISNKLINCV